MIWQHLRSGDRASFDGPAFAPKAGPRPPQVSPLIFLHGVDEPDDIWTMPPTDFVDCISLRVRKRSVARG